MSGKMTVSPKPRRAPSYHFESLFSSWRFAGIHLVTLELLLPSGSVVQCPYSVVKNGKTVSVTGTKYSYKTRVTLECLRGFLLEGSRTVVCGANSTWEPGLPKCTKGVKPTVPKTSPVSRKPGVKPTLPKRTKPEDRCVTLRIENGRVTYPQGGTEFGKDIHYYCDYGYHLVGKQILNCKFNGTKVFWDGDAPKCEKIFCKTPEKIKNGKYTNGHKDTFVFNEEIIYSCDSPNGTEKYMLIGESTLTCMATGLWSSIPPQCKEITCDIPVLKHGRSVSERKEKYFYQDVIEFECLEGFLLNGSKSISCGRNNTWEPKMPTCIKDIRPTTHPTTPPASKYPDPGVSVLMLLTLFIIILVACICLCQFLRRRKKRLEHPPSVPGLPDQPSFSVGPSSGPPPTEPAEPPPSLPSGPPPGAPIKPPPGAPIKPPPGAPIKPPPGAPA
ncbi:membrane cofactor protein-like isoform X1 [Saccopteryx leptura]|uniref:membrane cofactor protein-like isoform X1 n=1 Tax=Saccopteryx leptura TaxID=249018 RepID=UPI00339C55B4